MISLYFPKEDIKSQFINDMPYIKGGSGRMATYLAPYIQLIYILYRLFGWGQRQITGYLRINGRLKALIFLFQALVIYVIYFLKSQ